MGERGSQICPCAHAHTSRPPFHKKRIETGKHGKPLALPPSTPNPAHEVLIRYYRLPGVPATAPSPPSDPVTPTGF